MITKPLDLKRHLARPDKGFDLVPFLDLCLLGLFFALNSSQFIFAPGVSINLPQSGADTITGLPTTTVLTAHPRYIIFDGRLYRMDTIGPALDSYIDEAMSADAVLLIKSDREVTLEQFLLVYERAIEAGFAVVQLATEERPAPLSLTPRGAKLTHE